LLRFETCPEDTSKPHICSMILVMRRVLAPSTYMVAMADFSARSLREPFSSNDVRKIVSLSRT